MPLTVASLVDDLHTSDVAIDDTDDEVVVFVVDDNCCVEFASTNDVAEAAAENVTANGFEI